MFAPASLEQTVDALLFALRPRYWKQGDLLERSRRPSLSAGALHPISVLLFHERAAFRLNAESCALERLRFSDEAYAAWVSKCQRVLPEANGTFLALVADMARPRSAYANSESLVWRDAGALLQTIALVAELFGLGFCPLGILGNEVVTELHSDGQLLAVGAAAIGLRPEASPADSNQ
jgi:nitroreductase